MLGCILCIAFTKEVPNKMNWSKNVRQAMLDKENTENNTQNTQIKAEVAGYTIEGVPKVVTAGGNALKVANPDEFEVFANNKVLIRKTDDKKAEIQKVTERHTTKKLCNEDVANLLNIPKDDMTYFEPENGQPYLQAFKKDGMKKVLSNIAKMKRELRHREG